MNAIRIAVLAVTAAVVVACNPGDSRCDGGLTDAGRCGGDGGGAGGGAGGGVGGGSAGGAAGGSGGGSGAAPLSGTFDLTWNQGGAVTWTLQGRGLTLPVHDNGIDETNYDATGTVTISPTSYQEGSATCTLAEPAAKAFSKSYFFKVLKLPAGPAQRWGYLEQWNYTCTSAGGSQTQAVIVNFRVASGAVCSVPGSVPTPNAPTMSGSFTMNCSPPLVGTATWSFSP